MRQFIMQNRLLAKAFDLKNRLLAQGTCALHRVDPTSNTFTDFFLQYYCTDEKTEVGTHESFSFKCLS